MLAEVVDQPLFEIAAVAGKGQRQVDHDRLARVGVGGQPMRPRNGGQIERDGRLPGHNAEIVGCTKGLRHLPFGICLDGPGELDRGRQVGDHADPPGRASLARDRQRAIAGDGKALLWLCRGGDLAGAARDRLLHAQRTDLAIKAQRDHRPDRQAQRAGRDISEIERGAPGVGRRGDPAFPDRPDLCNRLPVALPDGLDLAHAPQRPEQQRHEEEQQRRIAQTVRVARRQPQVGLDRARLPRARLHPGQMRAPHRFGRRIAAADGLAVGNRGNRPPRQRGINPCQRLALRGPAEPAQAPDQRAQPGRDGPHDIEPERLERHQRQPAHQDRHHHQRHHDPKRPERPHHTLGHKARMGQHHRKAQMRRHIRALGQRVSPLSLMHGYRAATATRVCYRAKSSRHRWVLRG